jgi:hypothetical protein
MAPQPASAPGPTRGPLTAGRAAAYRAEPSTQSRPTIRPIRKQRPEPPPAREAQLVLSRIEPWSVMKFSFVASLVGCVILVVAVAALYYGLSSLGVFRAIERTINLVTTSKTSPGSTTSSWFSASTVLGYTLLAGAIDVVMITAISTLGAVIYNLITRLFGGIELTLKETD